jgi:hypothetical protein
MKRFKLKGKFPLNVTKEDIWNLTHWAAAKGVRQNIDEIVLGSADVGKVRKNAEKREKELFQKMKKSQALKQLI